MRLAIMSSFRILRPTWNLALPQYYSDEDGSDFRCPASKSHDEWDFIQARKRFNNKVANYDGMVQDDGLFLKLDKVSAQAPSITQQIGGANLHKNAGGRRSPTSPSTPSTDRSVASYVSTTTAEGVTYQGVKLEKKQSMSQIISQLKTRFGSSSTRKKGKKAAVAKKTARHDTFSSRLLWNPSGRWHDNWFVYQDGVLSGYKDVGFKPAEVVLDLKTCKLTSYSSGSAMRQLNLFKLTTGGGLSHFFLAWSDDIYETWLEILSCLVRETSEFGCSESKVLLHAKPSTESDGFGEGLVIPYESSFKVLASERIAQLSHSSENSGNDGDESGLESSITPSAVDTYQSRSQQQRQRMRLVHEASPGMMAETSEPEDLVALKDAYASPTSLVAALPANLALLPGEAKRHESKDSTSTSASTTDGDGGKVPAGDVTISEARVEEAKKVLRAKRPLLTRHRHSYIDPGERNRALAALARPHSNGDKFDVRIAGVDAALLMGSAPRTLKSPALNGNHSRGGSQDSSLSEMVWDALLEQQRRRVQKTSMGSEDDDRSVHSRASDPFDEERFPKDGDDLPAAVSSPEEDKLREELLLRKRRNSLTLERGTVQARLQALRSSGHGPKRGKSVDVIDGPSVNKAAAVALTGRLEEIDSQIDSIDMKIRAGGNSKPEKVTKKLPKQQEVAPRRATTGSGFITKFRRPLSKSRLSPHGIDVSHYVSVESLASTGSRDSKDSHRESPKFLQKLVAADKDGTIRPTELRCTRAIGSRDYSPVAVERVFSQIDVDDGVEYPALDKNRSKSMSSLLPWVLQQDESHDSQTMDALQKIEDFEKFSAILSNRMTQRTRGDVIDV